MTNSRSDIGPARQALVPYTPPPLPPPGSPPPRTEINPSYHPDDISDSGFSNLAGELFGSDSDSEGPPGRGPPGRGPPGGGPPGGGPPGGGPPRLPVFEPRTPAELLRACQPPPKPPAPEPTFTVNQGQGSGGSQNVFVYQPVFISINNSHNCEIGHPNIRLSNFDKLV